MQNMNNVGEEITKEMFFLFCRIYFNIAAQTSEIDSTNDWFENVFILSARYAHNFLKFIGINK